jgi:hypothetical protein
MTNPHTQELFRSAKQRFERDLDKTKLSDWLCAKTRLKGRPFSFDRYPFQRALVDETHDNAVTIKPSQVGVSEIYQRVALGLLARNPNRKGIYSYPDDEMRKKNVQTRVQPLYDTTQPFHQDKGDAVSSIQLMQLGTSFLYMTGSKVGDATSTDADFVFLDEYDLHDMQNAALFGSRLQNSDWKIKRYFSTPTYTSFGVDALYNISDQMSYLIKCDSCNHWQFPMFSPQWLEIPGLPGDINDLKEIDQEFIDRYQLDLVGSYVCCEKCRSKLDLGREDNRAWVAKYPSRTGMRGRKINCFSVATRPPKDIIAELLTYKTNDFLRGFDNSVLGEPTDASQNRLAEADILGCLADKAVPEIDKNLPTFLGIDMGHTCHMMVGQGHTLKDFKIVIAEKVPLAQIRERVSQICASYRVIGGCVDRHPESQIAKDLWELTEHRVVPAEYRGTVEINTKLVVGTLDEVEYIQVDRTTLLDEAAQAIRRKAVQINGYGGLSNEIKEHFRNMVREENPETPAIWKKLNQNDHFFHSLGFLVTSMKLRGYTEARYGNHQSLMGFAVAKMPGATYGLIGSSNTQRESKWPGNLFQH